MVSASGLRGSGTHWLLFFQYVSKPVGICVFGDLAELYMLRQQQQRRKYLGASALWVNNALKSLLLGLPTGQLISWHFDLSVQAGAKSQIEGTPNLNTRFIVTYYLMWWSIILPYSVQLKQVTNAHSRQGLQKAWIQEGRIVESPFKGLLLQG